MQVVGRIRSSYALQVHKVTSTRGEGFLLKKSSMCTNLSLIHSFSVTSRRGPPTSRRHFTCLCHVATWTSHVATSILHASVTSRRGPSTSRRQFCMSLSRRDVYLPRRDVNFYPLCHVATWIYTSRRQFLQASVTSRRCPSRRDVGFHPFCDVATSPRTSRRC